MACKQHANCKKPRSIYLDREHGRLGPIAWLHVWKQLGTKPGCDTQQKHNRVHVDALAVAEWVREHGPQFLRDAALNLGDFSE